MDKNLLKKLSSELKNLNIEKNTNIMEVCGTHTVAYFHTGVRDIFPKNLNLIDGPGCPVCVTTNGYLDRAVEIMKKYNVVLATFGDMVKVPASYTSLQKEKAEGRNIEVVYSPMDALELAKRNKEKEVVFLSVGFETTIPTEAATIKCAIENNIKNFSLLTGNKLTPPAVDALLASGEINLDGFILPGHVSSVTGSKSWEFVAEKYNKPAVIAGFESKDLLKGTLILLKLIKSGKNIVENVYKEIVSENGNTIALDLIESLYTVIDAKWRGIGTIPGSGLKLKDRYKDFDAEKKFPVDLPPEEEDSRCRCGEVLKGLITPPQCPLFGKKCTPREPVGACMVSFEGACSAYYKYSR
ncbi:MAG: hydrogenase formation protein HypD [Acidobacteriota bacterium]